MLEGLVSLNNFFILHFTGWFGNTGPLTDVGFFQLDEEMRKSKPGLPDVQFHLLSGLVETKPEKVLDMHPMDPKVRIRYCRLIL